MIPPLASLRQALLFFAASLALLPLRSTADANRLAYLDSDDPFYVGAGFPKLTTPQWVGEPGVEAVVILAIDDMRETPKYENVLRPLLDRLKQIDGRAPVSIFCNRLDVQNPQLQTWLKEGLSFEVHTLTHPCPLLANGSFSAAATNYHDCVELLNRVPGSQAVAFRMPCCDSMNSPSPRFYAEMFNQTSPSGQFLTADSSVMTLITSADKSLPRELVLDTNGKERFRKYFPTETNSITKLSLKWFGTTVENYPYPYVIGRLCWEFPAMVPSDWEAQNVHGPNEPATVADWEAALDATVLKQGTFTFIFHPHGWIEPRQMVEFIDYAVRKHGKKVKFLNFREAQERLNQNLLAGQSLRVASGADNGVRLLDLNNDGYLDVVIGNDQMRKTRLWKPAEKRWEESPFPVGITGIAGDAGVRFGVPETSGNTVLYTRNQAQSGVWRFQDGVWGAAPELQAGLMLDGQPVATSDNGRDLGVRFRDVEKSGHDELIVSNDKQNAVFAWSDEGKSWRKLAFALPLGASLVDGRGRDNGLRFADVNGDGYDDVLFSNEREFGVHMFLATPKTWLGWERGWGFKVAGGKHGAPG
ncbi:MAG TPA: VCBS repeat-containing protein, partial [Verrucomicrobiae bacterium]|nr:VCBS repeat-containing protein [Verrucomicrobiae bacterium]